jgi:hypothetical protein
VTTWEPVVGHALASTGVLGIVHAVLVLERGEILPTFGLERLDDACELDYVLESSRQVRGSGVLALTVGFGGQNGATIVRRFDVEEAQPRIEAVAPEVRLVASRVVGGLRSLAADGCAESGSFEPERLAEMFPGRWNPRRSLPRGVDVLVAAVSGAAEDAGWWTPGQESLVDGGLVVGTDYQSLCVASSFARDLMADGPGGVSPSDFLFSLPSSAAAVVGILFGFRHYQATIAADGLSGFLGVGHAVDRLASGRIPRLMVGVLSVVTPEMLPVLDELGYDLDDNALGLEMAVACCLEASGTNGSTTVSGPRLGFEGLVRTRSDARQGGRTEDSSSERREFGGNTALFPDNNCPDGEPPDSSFSESGSESGSEATSAWLDDLPPGFRALAAPSLLALLRADERRRREPAGVVRLVHRDPAQAMAVAMTIEP